MEGEREPCGGMLQTPGGDTNWGVGGESQRRIHIFQLSWIEETFAQLWQMSGMIALVSNLQRSYVGGMLPLLTRKTQSWKQGWQGGRARVGRVFCQFYCYLLKRDLALRSFSGSFHTFTVGIAHSSASCWPMSGSIGAAGEANALLKGNSVLLFVHPLTIFYWPRCTTVHVNAIFLRRAEAVQARTTTLVIYS